MKDPIKIVFEDEHLIVINKAEGLLSVGTSRGREEITAHSLINNYVRNTSPRGKYHTRGLKPRAFIVHRLDRETSGLMVFAKNEEIKRLLQENWEEAVTHRGYVAVINSAGKISSNGEVIVEYLIEEDENGHEKLNFNEGRITSWLKENRAMMVYSSARNNGGQIAVTDYKILSTNTQKNKTLLQLELQTGRKNQIRVHMQEIGSPIFGDKKYFGENPAQLAENKKADRLYLHAYALSFIHPVTGKEMVFNTGIPRSFKNI